MIGDVLPTTPVGRCLQTDPHDPHDHYLVPFVPRWCDGLSDRTPPCRQIQPGRWIGSCERDDGHDGDHLRWSAGRWVRWTQQARAGSFSLVRERPTAEMAEEATRNAYDLTVAT